MISYAQNFEDVILERIFKDFETGTYVDIGACHPVYDSVTQHFYLRGWSGINIEPQPKLFAELQAVRQRDINLNICIGMQPGRKTLYITRNVGTSTLNPELAEQYRECQEIDQEITVELITLNQLWREKLQGRQVDFMKIDVEGFEREVLAGADFSLVSPSILVVEATRPNTNELCHQQWEMLVLDYYEFFYFDGLNRFYSRKGFAIDTASASTPPNVFDHFKTYPQLLLEQANNTLTQERDALSEQLQNYLTLLTDKDHALSDAGNAYSDLKTEYDSLHEQLHSANRELATIYSERDKAHQGYQTLLAAFKSKEKDLRMALDAYQATETALVEAAQAYQHLASLFEAKDQQLLAMIEHLRVHDSPLAVPDEADQTLQAPLSLAQQELTNVRQELEACSNRLHEIAAAYDALQKELSRKESDMIKAQKYLQEKDTAILEATRAYETLQKTVEEKDFALARASQAYNDLKDLFDAKSQELGELHAALSPPKQPKAP
jgi:FkbM family methyltransferase